MNLLQIFTTPIWESKFPNFDEHKSSFIAAAKSFRESNVDGPRPKTSNVHGGYQSPITLTRQPEFAPLFDYVCQFGLKAAFDLQFFPCDAVVTSAWVNFQESRNDMILDHVHGDTFSGVFYLEAPENSGKLSFTNPGLNQMWQGTQMAENRNKFTSEKLQIVPAEGSIFLWPSYLPHKTLPNEHDEARISISFNIFTLPKGHAEQMRAGNGVA
jgi:uncharacterized protein (TIGR02466 family)